jgi:alcohol dehydrogenase class IV
MGAQGTDLTALADESIARVRALLQDIGIPPTLAELGLKPSSLAWVAEQSMLSARLVNNNPRPLQMPDMAEILDDAFHGRIRAAHPLHA